MTKLQFFGFSIHTVFYRSLTLECESVVQVNYCLFRTFTITKEFFVSKSLNDREMGYRTFEQVLS
jgi:hypothetical protein